VRKRFLRQLLNHTTTRTFNTNKHGRAFSIQRAFCFYGRCGVGKISQDRASTAIFRAVWGGIRDRKNRKSRKKYRIQNVEYTHRRCFVWISRGPAFTRSPPHRSRPAVVARVQPSQTRIRAEQINTTQPLPFSPSRMHHLPPSSLPTPRTSRRNPIDPPASHVHRDILARSVYVLYVCMYLRMYPSTQTRRRHRRRLVCVCG
jgi:hypothetical protein